MKLRDHPLIAYGGHRSWPPVWTFLRGGENIHPKGEVGVLKEAKISTIEPARIFLYILCEGGEYLGCLLVDDPAFCQQLAPLLQEHCGRHLTDIGSLDVSSTL